MKLKLVRYEYNDDCTIGELYIDDTYFCVTLEDKVRPKNVKVKGSTAIPSGVYTISKRYSPRFKKDLPYLLNVTNFEYILIHSGNTSDDTEGCILVGEKVGELNNKKAILNSRNIASKLIDKIFSALDKKQTVTIEIINTKVI